MSYGVQKSFADTDMLSDLMKMHAHVARNWCSVVHKL